MDEILNTIMGRIPRPSNPFASRRWKTFSVADWNAAEMEKGGIVEWREWKDRGNALFQEKDYAGARAMYGKACMLALDPFRNGGVNAALPHVLTAPLASARPPTCRRSDSKASSPSLTTAFSAAHAALRHALRRMQPSSTQSALLLWLALATGRHLVVSSAAPANSSLQDRDQPGASQNEEGDAAALSRSATTMWSRADLELPARIPLAKSDR